MKHRLKEIRKELGLTQNQLADMCGASLQMIQYIENGQRQLTPKWMEKLEVALGIEPWMLWVDPKGMVGDKDREIVSRYHALPDNLRAAVDAILFGENPDA